MCAAALGAVKPLKLALLLRGEPLKVPPPLYSEKRLALLSCLAEAGERLMGLPLPPAPSLLGCWDSSHRRASVSPNCLRHITCRTCYVLVSELRAPIIHSFNNLVFKVLVFSPSSPTSL